MWIGGGVGCVLLLSLVAMATGRPDDPPPPAAARVTSGTASPDGTPAEGTPPEGTPPEGTRTVATPSSAAESPEAEPPTRGERPAAPPTGTGNVVTAPKPAPADPWAGGVPRNLARMKRAVDSGREISERADRGLIRIARDNPSDPRPHLLLAGAFLSRGWRSDAVERYELAYDRDPSSRGDPRMLHDLVMLGADSAAGGKASRAVQRIYGREALAEIDRQLGAGGLGRDGRARLLRLRAAIENGS
jgi:hypothetical protein